MINGHLKLRLCFDFYQIGITPIQSARRPFWQIARSWQNWKDQTSGEWLRTFAIITTDANELVGVIHDSMPLILAPTDYVRWLSDEYDPHDLMRPFPAEPMRMWPISTRVNKPENDDPSILEPIELSAAERAREVPGSIGEGHR